MVLCLKLRIIEYPCIYQKLGVLLGVTFSCTQMNIKRNIVFSLEKRKKDGKPVVENVPIRMRVIYNHNRIEFTTGYRIDSTKWDDDKQRVKNGCTNKLKQSAAEINSDLLKYYADIQDIFKEFEVIDVIPTTEQLKTTFNNRLKKNIPQEPELEEPTISFWDTFNEFVQECGIQNNWTDATYEKFAATKKHLEDFDTNLTFEALNESKLTEYVNFLRDTKNLRNSTISKQMGFLRWFLRWAKKKDYNKNNTFELFKPKLKTTQKKVIFLTWAELTKLKEYKIPETKKYLDRVRDVFLFQCFTGLRYSDVFNLRRSDIKENHIEITTVKTADSLIIELNNHSKTILDKYKDVHFEHDKVLPVITNQKMNDYLKELAELAEINEPVRETYYKGNQRIDEVTPKYALLGTHAGRRTFICNALSLGIPAQVVMKWTGHSDYKAMKPYIDIADEIKANAMDKFNQL
jgi:integrase